MKNNRRTRLTSLTCLILFLLPITISATATAKEVYRFERMWPAFKTSWYYFRPSAIVLDSSGNIYISDWYNQRIEKFSPEGTFLLSWGSNGTDEGDFCNPYGIGIDAAGDIYVADACNNRIQKFSPDGVFIKSLGSAGTDDGQFNYPTGIAIDKNGNMYIADSVNSRIQKFTSNGKFLLKWGEPGTGNGQFGNSAGGTLGITVDNSNYIYVADSDNLRIQKFDSNGMFIDSWGDFLPEDDPYAGPIVGITSDPEGYLYVADSENIRKLSSDGTIVFTFGSYGAGPGQFNTPLGIAVDAQGYIYLADFNNQRIQKYGPDGSVLAIWGTGSTSKGEFSKPCGITQDKDGNLLIVDTGNNRIQKFTSEGIFITSWSTYGQNNEAFNSPLSITTGPSGNIYVFSNGAILKFSPDGNFITSWSDALIRSGGGITTDRDEHVYIVDRNANRIIKFTHNGELITSWGSKGTGDGQFDWMQDIVIDSDGNIYISDCRNTRIQKFTSEGKFIKAWTTREDDKYSDPRGMAIDNESNIFVVDYGNRILKFNSEGKLLESWGSGGNTPGQFMCPEYLTVGSDGSMYVSDTGNNRIQVFKKYDINSKAVIVAGGGPFEGNNLWDATQLNANFAYRSLTFQGFTKDTIYYLSADTDLDLDGNGEADDVDADATNENLQYAITEWASDADDVVVYLTDHGGDKTFRMSGTETLKAEDLNSWLAQLQETVPGLVTVVYDACQSGTFIPVLTPSSGKQRIVITSTSTDEPAYFVNEGVISFSYVFWSRIFDGDKVYDAFVSAKNAMQVQGYQNALLDDNGNGMANEKEDGDIALEYAIGNGVLTGGDIPVIGTVTEEITLSGETSATIWVDRVTSSNIIVKVWAVITPPDNGTQYTSNPITDLPTVELTKSDNNSEYEGTYNGFTIHGEYKIVIYAEDKLGNISLPEETKVTQTKGSSATTCPAVLVAGGEHETTTLLRRFRDEVLIKTPEGRESVRLFYRHAPELFSILSSNPGIMAQCKDNLKHIVPVIASALDHNRNISLRSLIADENLLCVISARASSSLKKDLAGIVMRKTKH